MREVEEVQRCVRGQQKRVHMHGTSGSAGYSTSQTQLPYSMSFIVAPRAGNQQGALKDEYSPSSIRGGYNHQAGAKLSCGSLPAAVLDTRMLELPDSDWR